MVREQRPWTEYAPKKRARPGTAAAGAAACPVPGVGVPNDALAAQTAQDLNPDGDSDAPQFMGFTYMALGKRLAFGSMVGTSVGAMFGAMDAMTQLNKGATFDTLSKAQRHDKVMTAAKGAGRVSVGFGAFFGFFYGVRYNIAVARAEDDIANDFAAGLVALAPVVAIPRARPQLPWAITLLAFDVVHNRFM
jgi:hypothetical protein